MFRLVFKTSSGRTKPSTAGSIPALSATFLSWNRQLSAGCTRQPMLMPDHRTSPRCTVAAKHVSQRLSPARSAFVQWRAACVGGTLSRAATKVLIRFTYRQPRFLPPWMAATFRPFLPFLPRHPINRLHGLFSNTMCCFRIDSCQRREPINIDFFVAIMGVH